MPLKIWKDEIKIQGCIYMRFGNNLATELNRRQPYWSIWKFRLSKTAKTCNKDPQSLAPIFKSAEDFKDPSSFELESFPTKRCRSNLICYNSTAQLLKSCWLESGQMAYLNGAVNLSLLNVSQSFAHHYKDVHHLYKVSSKEEWTNQPNKEVDNPTRQSWWSTLWACINSTRQAREQQQQWHLQPLLNHLI